jgi:flagellar protein FliO/FliZ
MTGGGAMQVLLSLAIVIGAIVLLGWLARRLRVMPRGRSGALRVVDEVALGAKERAVILEVDGARLVLGVGEGRVMLLHRGEAAAQRAMDPAEVSAVSSGGDTIAQPSFGDLLQKALGR